MNLTFRCPCCQALGTAEIAVPTPPSAASTLGAPPPGDAPVASGSLPVGSPAAGKVPASDSFACSQCRAEFPLPANFIQDGRLTRCLVCPSEDLFVRKDFSQKYGVAIVVTGFALSTVAWAMHYIYLTYGILFATAFIDLILYSFMGDCLQCYRCQAIYRHTPTDQHQAFDLTQHEKHRQLAARLPSSAGARDRATTLAAAAAGQATANDGAASAR